MGTQARPRVLLIAEAANPEWVSVPLEGWAHCRALSEITDALVATQIRNREAIERTGWTEGREFITIDSEAVGAPIYRASQALRRRFGLGWTLNTAAQAVPYYWFEALLWRKLGPRIRAGEFDLVHRVTPLTPTSPSLIAQKCHQARVPFVWGPVNGGVPWPPGFRKVLRAEGEWLSYVRAAHKLMPGYGATRRRASALIAGSESAWAQFGKYEDRCVYIPENAVDPARFKLVSTPWSGSGPLRVAFVGRLVPYKGADVLLEALAPLIQAGKVVVDIVGDGPEMSSLKAQVEHLGLAAGVELPGWVAHDQLQNRLVRAQVFGFPSVREFGGTVVLEAMALGLVPVVAGYAGPNELVTDPTGVRVPFKARADLVLGVRSAFERLMRDPAALAEMARKARARALGQFTWPMKARQTLEVYRWVLGQRGKPDFGMPLPDQP